jgi:hypothetical protein
MAVSRAAPMWITTRSVRSPEPTREFARQLGRCRRTGGGSDTTDHDERLRAERTGEAASDGTFGGETGLPATALARGEAAPPFVPVEKRAVDPAVVDAQSGGRSFGIDSEFGIFVDARLTFLGEVARFESVLGVYFVDDRGNGALVDPRIVFPRIEQHEPDPACPMERPGGGPLAEGDSVLLSDVLQLPVGLDYSYHLFFVANGATRNDPRLFDPGEGTLVFENAEGGPATVDDQEPPRLLFVDARTGEHIPVQGDVFHLTGTRSDFTNPLNPGGTGQILSFQDPGVPESGLVGPPATLYVEDLRFADGDRDFNDLVIRVEEFVARDEAGGIGLAAAPGPEAIRIEPGSGRTELAASTVAAQVLDLSAFGLDFATLDSNRDGAVGRGDAFLRAREHRVRIDLGAAAGEAPGIDLLIVKGTSSLGEEAFG